MHTDSYGTLLRRVKKWKVRPSCDQLKKEDGEVHLHRCSKHRLHSSNTHKCTCGKTWKDANKSNSRLGGGIPRNYHS